MSCTVVASVDVCPQSFSHDFSCYICFHFTAFFFSLSHFCSQLCEAVCRDLNSECSRLLGDVFFSFFKQPKCSCFSLGIPVINAISIES